MTHAAERMHGDRVILPGSATYEDTRTALFARNGLIDGTPVREPIHDAYRPTASAPLDFSKTRVQEWQYGIEDMLQELLAFELSGEVSDKVLQFVINSVMSRLCQREGTNSSAHSRRLYKRPKYSEVDAPRSVVKRACRASLEGTATVAQVEMSRRAFGAPSAEYGNLTVARDKRAEHLSGLFHETEVLLGDGYDPMPYTVTIDTFDRDPGEPSNNHIGAMRIKAKRSLGMLDDGTEVKERSFVILDMSQGGPVDQQAVAEIIHASKEHKKQEVAQKRGRHSLKLALSDDEALYRLQHREAGSETELVEPDYEALPHVGALLGEVSELQLNHSASLARNTTIYGYNESIDKIIHARQDDDLQRKLREAHVIQNLLRNVFDRLPGINRR